MGAPFTDTWTATDFPGNNDGFKGHLAACDRVPGGPLEVLNADWFDDVVQQRSLVGSDWIVTGVPNAPSGTAAVACADFDNDGLLDLAFGGDTGEQLQFGSGMAELVAAVSGTAVTTSMVAADVDDDGDLDLLSTRHDGPPTLWLSDVAVTAPDHFQLRLRDSRGDRCAPDGFYDVFGAQATVDGIRQELLSTNGRGTSAWPVLHWGGVSGVTEVHYRWPDGIPHDIRVNVDAIGVPHRVIVTRFDADGDGVPDDEEGTTDDDGDGFGADHDDDADGDGIPDRVELALLDTCGLPLPDLDGDMIPDHADSDTDDDGYSDAEELGCGGGACQCGNTGSPGAAFAFLVGLLCLRRRGPAGTS